MLSRSLSFPFAVLLAVLFLLSSCTPKSLAGQNVCIEEHDSIIVYYPEYTSLDLIGSSRVPHGDDILYCCGAAFTAKCLKYFTHDNIRCGHVCHGHFHKGSPEAICTGTSTHTAVMAAASKAPWRPFVALSSRRYKAATASPIHTLKK